MNNRKNIVGLFTKQSFVVYLCLKLIIVVFYLNIQNSISLDRIVNSIQHLNSINPEVNQNLFESINLIEPSCKCHNSSIKLEYLSEHFYQLFSVSSNQSKLLYKISKSKLDKTFLTCDQYHSLRRGTNLKVISYSLYGRQIKYYKSIENIALMIKKYYPDWIMRIYYDNSVDKHLVCKIECQFDHVDFCNVHNLNYQIDENKNQSFENYFGMYWRWLPIGDDFVDFMMSRDTDSWITDREFSAVKAWLDSDQPFHIMRDHPFHFFPILGGLWGMASVKNRTLSDLIFSKIIDQKLIRPYNNKLYLEDQYFLINHVWSHVNTQSLIHDSYFCQDYGGLPFPTKRPSSDCFVSCSECCLTSKKSSIIYPTNATLIGRECPHECRLNKQWKFC